MAIFLCMLTALIGLAIMASGIHLLLKSLRARYWPTAQGTILDSRVREAQDDGATVYDAHILYEYSVNGVKLRSDVWRLGVGRSSFMGFAKRAVAKYPIGAPVMVYFNPDKPTDAMLETGNASWAFFVFGLAFFLGGANAVIHLLQNHP
jgi:Protein of unknown function (DUF3592)